MFPVAAFFRRFSLRVRLIGVMILLFVLTTGLNYWLTNRIEQDALAEVQSHVETLSRAIQISVEQLPAQSGSAAEILRDYVSRLRSSGVEEIRILNADRETIATSRGSSGRGSQHLALATNKEQTSYELTIPVVAQERLLGYVNVHLVLDNFTVLFHNMLFYKILASLAVFVFGIIVSIGLVSYLTKPVETLRVAADEVAAGNLDVQLPDPSTPDLGALVSAFRHMNAGLKEQKLLERRLREQEKAAALGQMAAGIAHDIRNPLNFIGLAFEHLKSKQAEHDPASSALLDDAHSELMRVNAMIQDFLDFGKDLEPRLSLHDVERILSEGLDEVVRRHQTEQPQVRLVTGGGGTHLLVDPKLLKRAFVNLLENALEAGGWDGLVRAGVSKLDDPQRVVIWVQDSGPGIAPELIDKVFNPYFTTKPSGIGLGLALVKKWVGQMGGEILVHSDLGHGSRFEISFSDGSRESRSTENEQASEQRFDHRT
jgi:signal transduction histidine kinase